MAIWNMMRLDIDGLRKWNAKREFDGKKKASVYNKLASFLENAVKLPKALDMILRHASQDGKKPNATTAIVMRAWLKDVNNGKSLGRAVQGWVSDGDRIVIEAGDRAGTLPGALRNALFIEQSNKKIRSTIKSGVAYPLLLIAVAIGLLMMFGLYIIPGYEDIMPREKWSGGAASMLRVSDFVNYWLLPLLISVAAIIGTIMWSMPKWVGPTRVKFDKYPPWSVYRLINGAGFMLSVSALVKAGVQMPDILKTLKRESTPWYDERMTAAKKHVDNGVNLGEALYLAGHGFPDTDTVSDLRAFAEMEGFDEKLEQLGREWVQDSVDKVAVQMAVFKNIAMILLGLVFAVIAGGTASINLQLMQAGANGGM